MRWIAMAGAVLAGFLGAAGSAAGAELVRINPPGFLVTDPSFLTAPPEPQDSRVFIAERGRNSDHTARIMIIDSGEPVTTPFLAVNNVDVIGERGLMSLAFAPDFGSSGLFYVFYTAAGPDALDPSGQTGDIRIVEYRAPGPDRNVADPASARLVLKIPHSAGNHNGGWMEFGPDGLLYISVGDNANSANAQSLGNLHGKVLRIDPADPPGPGAYTVPADNPFVGDPGARGEIYTLGLRNPYRGSFTPDGRLTIADVGEGTWEEVNAGNLAGRNMGWPVCEGRCSPANPALTDPVFAYRHDDADGYGGGCAITGGHVVEDPALAGLTGRYLFADFCRADQPVRSIDLDTPGGDFAPTGLFTFGNIVAFGQDSLGCSYVLTQHDVFRIVGGPGAPAGCPIPPPSPDPVSYTSYIPNRAVIARRLRVGARCSISCSASAVAKVKISRNRFRRKPATFRLKKVTATLPGNRRGTLFLAIPLKRAKAMKKAARNGSRVTARVTVDMKGADGSGGSGTRTTRLVRPKRR
jgi:glucose/arabinose dehydrogenase